MAVTNIPWWQDRVIYQIYPMSFCDSNGDGIGDIPGIISKLDYIKNMGVGAIWLSPVYPSPNRDNGYDISNYCNIHENYGTLKDMKALLAECKKLDIKVIMDLVINHTSDQHEWFQKSRMRIEPYTDFYIWRPAVDGKKPSNWTGFFGEDCWEYDEVRGEYYLHLFAKEQPDLNYQNEAVIEAVEDVMRFWLRKGVAGFRCDVINLLYKSSLEDGKKKFALTGSEHYISTEGLHELLKRFNAEVFSRYKCFTVGETVFVTPEMAKDLISPKRKELNAVFSFEHMETDCFGIKWLLRPFSPNRFFKALTKWQTSLEWNALYFENHDQPRSVSRFGDDKRYHDESAKALATLLLTLRGTVFIYQGQEIGMTNFDFTDMSMIRDVESLNIWKLAEKMHIPKCLRWKMIKTKGRDNARTPMQWGPVNSGGFTSGEPWLPTNNNYTEINVFRQDRVSESVLGYYKRLIFIRNTNEVFKQGRFREVYRHNGVYAFDRVFGGVSLTTVVNLTPYKKRVPLSGAALISNYGFERIDGELLPYEAAIIRR